MDLNQVSKLLRLLLVAVAAAFVVVYIVIALFRIRYPFELEWIEGSMVEEVSRILSGQKLYVKPSLNFVPYLYTPLYFYVSAALARIVGIGFIPLRAVSLVSSLGSFYLIYVIVQEETSRRFPAMLAAGLFAATYRISGAWFDLARVDSLFLFFLLVSIYLIRFRQSLISYILAGVFITLSFLTKQTALMISVPIILYPLYANRRISIYPWGVIAVLIAGSTILFDRMCDGWYVFYVFRLPSHHPLENFYGGNFWTKDLLRPLPIACLMSLLYGVLALSGRNWKGFLFYLLTSSGMLIGSWVSRLHYGSYDNVLIPAYACISILFGLGTNLLLQSLSRISMRRQGVLEIAVYALCILQFVGLYYKPSRQIPTHEDEQAGWSLVRRLETMRGDVWLPYHGYLPVLAGKKSFAHVGAMNDIMIGPDGSAKTDLINEAKEAILGRKFTAILMDSTLFPVLFKDWLQDENWVADLDRAGYCLESSIFPDGHVFRPVTGGKIRPELMVYQCSIRP